MCTQEQNALKYTCLHTKQLSKPRHKYIKRYHAYQISVKTRRLHTYASCLKHTDYFPNADSEFFSYNAPLFTDEDSQAGSKRRKRQFSEPPGGPLLRQLAQILSQLSAPILKRSVCSFGAFFS